MTSATTVERAGIAAVERIDGPLFIVVGVFDGIHLGHRYLIERLVAEAATRSARPAVLTFDSHPDELISGAAPPLLIDPGERVQLLAAAGVRVVVVEHFDAALRRTPFDAFVDGIRARADLAGFLMTPDAAFGKERGGTPETVAALGRNRGFDVVVVPPFRIDGDKVSSSAIRALIAAGDLAAASRLLGRRYGILGRLRAARSSPAPVSGAALTGTPVADAVAFEPALPVALPPSGSYAVDLELDDAFEGDGEVRSPASTTLEVDRDASTLRLVHLPSVLPARARIRFRDAG